MDTINQVILGLQIFAKYSPDINAAHDIILAAPGLKEGLLSKEDKLKLDDTDWFWNDELDCYSIFV